MASRSTPVTRPFTLKLLLVKTHNGTRPVGSYLEEVHVNDVPRIKKVTYITLTELAPASHRRPAGTWRIRYRRIHFHCGCVGQRPDGPKRFIPNEELE